MWNKNALHSVLLNVRDEYLEHADERNENSTRSKY